MNWQKLVSGLFVLLFAGIAFCATMFFLQMHRELNAQRMQEAASQARLLEAQARLEEQQKYLDRLQHDPALIESVIRKKLGYVRAGEFVFRFEENRNP